MQRVSVKSNTTGITYFFDVTFKETHSFTNQITQNPVQTGAAVNDHVYQQPCTFTWDVGVSDCLGAMGKGTSWSSSVYAFAVLESMWQTADVLTITTEFHMYTNMIIKSFVVNRDKNSMFAMRATVVFQEIIVTEAVIISVAQKTTSYPQATGQTNLGVKATSISTKYKTLTISESLLGSATATYGGNTMSLTTYFQKYSSDMGKFKAKSMELPDYVVTPIINNSITSNTTFTLDGKKFTYDQLLAAYGK